MTNKAFQFTEVLSRTGVLIAGGTALLYVIEIAYLDGYLAEWGINRTLLSTTFYQVLYDGFYLFYGFVLYGVTFFLLAIAVIGSIALVFTESDIYKRWIKKIRKNPEHETPLLEQKLTSWLKSSVGSLMFLFIFLLSLWYFEQQGIKDAKAIVLSYKDKKLDQKMLLKIKGSDNEESMVFIIYCGSVMCSAIDLEKNEVVIFKKDEHRLVRAQPVLS